MLRLLLAALWAAACAAMKVPHLAKRLPTMRTLKSDELLKEERGRAERLLKFIDASPEPFHVVDTVAKQLRAMGFTRLSEGDCWKGAVKSGGKYFFTRNGSSLIAFVVGAKFAPGGGVKVIGTHVDSPTLKIKPRSKRAPNSGLIQLNVETYGGGLWHTFFDRDLSIAGRVLVRTGDGVEYRLVKVSRPILRIPNLAIHLRTPEERETFKVNKEDHLVPILCDEVEKGLTGEDKDKDKEEKEQWSSEQQPELLSLLARELGVPEQDVVDFELSIYDTQPATMSGLNEEFICASRLDNLASTFVAVESLAEWSESPLVAEDADVSIIALFDHEEVGSQSSPGAGSTLMQNAIGRISSAFGDDSDAYKTGLSKSLVLSVDMAHARHPNYASRHESSHAPRLNSGVVIKTNSQQRYATNGLTAYLVREIGRRAGVPVQEFVVRNDCPCGTTVGPVISAQLGVRCVDLGMPMLSMHSIRETSGQSDLTFASRLFAAFFSPLFREIDNQLKPVD